ncbi:EamA family transporter, partial [Mesorhizobium sp. M2D.F.Ca.ET.223.01.1.1]
MTSMPIAKPQAHVGAMPILGLLGSMLSVQVDAAFS